MVKKAAWFAVWFGVPLALLFLFVSGCFAPAQFGAPGRTGIKGVVVMPENTCYVYECTNPQVSEGEPGALAEIELRKEDGSVVARVQADACGRYEINNLTDSCYILYAQVPGGNAVVKKVIYPLTSGIVNDVGEANYYTTAQVIIYEVAEKKYPDQVQCSDVPGFNPPPGLLNAVKRALAECRDAQKDPKVMEIVSGIVENCFGSPPLVCPTFPVSETTPTPTPIPTPTPTPTPEPTPTPGCPDGYSINVSLEADKYAGNAPLEVTFTASSAQSGGSYPVTYYWDLDNDGEYDDGTGNPKTHTFDTPGTYLVWVKAVTECGFATAGITILLAEPEPTPTPTPTPGVCQDETAWAEGDRYNPSGQGNWAMYVKYEYKGGKVYLNGVEQDSVNLIAGQFMTAGTVRFSQPSGKKVTITITLNSGWRFNKFDDLNHNNVHIQGYNSPPSGNPAPGQFQYKGHASSSPYTITVDKANYYGVHVEVEGPECSVQNQ